ncbi:MAG TPA: bifunctional YncE family protein/alkaline phosphatase family protein [Bacteroidales bacterium]|nr:bifunctional YncE family protein/alkaline phosphatase family protein [Bacteroidales bacterium]
MNFIVKKLLPCLIILGSINFFSYSQSSGEIEKNRVKLPNGWSLTPVGQLYHLGDLPLNIAVSPSKKIAAVTNNGYGTQLVQLVDIKTGRFLDSVILKKSWLGLAFSADGKFLYASGGNDNIIIKYSVIKNKLVKPDTIFLGKPWPQKISVAGITADKYGKKLYAVTKEDNSLYVIDIQSKNILSKHELGGEGYTCVLSPDQKTLYISCWGCDKIIMFDTEKQAIKASVIVGDNPNDICISKNGQYLFVANANDNSVSIIDTRQNKVIETLNAALYPDSPSGSTSNGVALSEDEKTLFIANADNNCLAVFDVSIPGRSKSRGFIPTAWYPTCVRIAKDKILVSNGKGTTSMANPFGPNPDSRATEVIHHEGGKETRIKVQYIGGLFKGTLQMLNIPDAASMAVYSQAVYNNTPYVKEKELTSEAPAGNPVPSKVGSPSPIKYVFYVIKENRTYDQVLGDMSEGNGDKDLVLFGEKITPNQHAIAREFVLLDNFYVNGEVSADGHSWTMGAYATDFLEKNWPTSYSGRGGSYPGEGGKKTANNKKWLWDACAEEGVTYRSYGEFISDRKANVPVLENHFCKEFIGWDLSIRDTVRFRWWKEDFDSLLEINALPALSTIRFGNNHTEGLNLGKPTPFAHAADNDLAVGMFIDYLSHSPVWESSLILIVEDDAQNGPDHVDAHRSPAFLAGGFLKQGFVDHTAYTTASMLRTMELILGLPPMSQYDAAATPLWRCLSNTADHPAYTVRPANIDLNDKNTQRSQWQQLSETFNFTAEDKVNDFQFNEVIWRAVKGLDSQCPPAVRAAFLQTNDEEEEDEDQGSRH